MKLEITPPPVFLTLSGTARELKCATATLRRKMASHVLLPDGVVVACQGAPGSALFRADRLPEIATTLASKPK